MLRANAGSAISLPAASNSPTGCVPCPRSLRCKRRLHRATECNLDVCSPKRCLAEKERLSGAKFVLHNVEADPADIGRLNQMVDDYNRKCGSPNYANFARREVFRGEVQARRDALWAEGIARFPAAARKLTGK